jgi:hypothetical protein
MAGELALISDGRMLAGARLREVLRADPDVELTLWRSCGHTATASRRLRNCGRTYTNLSVEGWPVAPLSEYFWLALFLTQVAMTSTSTAVSLISIN